MFIFNKNVAASCLFTILTPLNSCMKNSINYYSNYLPTNLIKRGAAKVTTFNLYVINEAIEFRTVDCIVDNIELCILLFYPLLNFHKQSKFIAIVSEVYNEIRNSIDVLSQSCLVHTSTNLTQFSFQ